MSSLEALKKIYFCFTLFFTYLPLVAIFLLEECNEFIMLYSIYLCMNTIITIIGIRSIFINSEYFRNNMYIPMFRIMQLISGLFGTISLIYFLTNDKYCSSYHDLSINTCYFMYSLSTVIILQIYINYFKNEERIIPTYTYTPELSTFKDILKGEIKEDIIEECCICLEKNTEQKENKENQDIESGEKTNCYIKVVILNCSHKFHYTCLNNCFLNSIKRCPLCRIEYIN